MSSNTEPWSNKSTIAIIDAYKQYIDIFNDPKTKSQGWTIVSNHLHSLNINKSPKDCRVKWHNLSKSYRIIKVNKRDPGKQTKFFYFDEMDKILGSTKRYTEISSMETANAENNTDKNRNNVIEVDGSSNEPHKQQQHIDQEAVTESRINNEKKVRNNYKNEYYKRKIEEIDQKKNFREKILKFEEEKLDLERAKFRLASEKFLYKKQCRDATINLQF